MSISTTASRHRLLSFSSGETSPGTRTLMLVILWIHGESLWARCLAGLRKNAMALCAYFDLEKHYSARSTDCNDVHWRKLGLSKEYVSRPWNTYEGCVAAARRLKLVCMTFCWEKNRFAGYRTRMSKNADVFTFVPNRLVFYIMQSYPYSLLFKLPGRVVKWSGSILP